ncbi:MAG TPA: type II toxin-antitoxin system RelE/ParE family toxin [Candidatus Angelobacter sp.]|jgi:plasmid stabilization system protein ParE|nr:type II toxin-antitoxin system RelE/ParE family toxin [Candidatus Angelobacter sp.]
MSRQVEIHPAALAEAEAAVTWYAERSSRAPAAFIEEIDSAVKSILNAPKRWPIFEMDCRRVPLVRFPFSLVYREKSSDIVQIVAVAHGRRRPNYWKARNR